MPRHRVAGRPHAFARVRALLAAATVLGVGATMTLASWTDNEYGQGTFGASVFDTESSVNGSTWADNSSSPGATMTFDTTGMSPNTQRYSALLIRGKANSVAGTLALAGATVSPGGTDETTVLGAALRYRVVLTTGTCTAAAFTGSPSFLVGGASSYATLTTAGSSTPAIAAATSSPGAATGLCFEISLPSGAANTLQGTSATAIWHVTATSG